MQLHFSEPTTIAGSKTAFAETKPSFGIQVTYEYGYTRRVHSRVGALVSPFLDAREKQWASEMSVTVS